MIEKTGWKAIIYNAPWAYFEKGQEGVIVSEDGKTCETTVDDLSRIKIIADENDTLETRSGTVLFKQKGSELQDIVPLFQEASRTKNNSTTVKTSSELSIPTSSC